MAFNDQKNGTGGDAWSYNLVCVNTLLGIV